MIGDGKPVAVPAAQPEPKIEHKEFSINPTSGVIDLSQKQMLSQVDQEIEAQVFAGEKTRKAAEIEKIDKRIQLMQREI